MAPKTAEVRGNPEGHCRRRRTLRRIVPCLAYLVVKDEAVGWEASGAASPAPRNQS